MFKHISKFALVVMAVFALAACGPDTSTPEGIKEAMLDTSSRIQKVTAVAMAQGGTSWVISYNFEVFTDPIFMASDEIMRVTKDMISDKLIKADDEITYLVEVDTVDKLGNKDTTLVMKLAWTGANLNKINWKNINSWDFTNLVSLAIIQPIFYEEFVKFLQNENNLKYNQEFIKKVIVDSGLEQFMPK